MPRGPLPALVLAAVLACPVPAAAQAGDGPVPSSAAVNGAIERGVAYLLASQNRDGSWGVDLYERGTPWHDFRDGATALAIYTLMKCGFPPDHPALVRAAAFLLESDVRHTYSAGIQLHALGSLGTEQHRKRMRELVELLEELGRVDGWDYPGLGRSDLSNTQVAALGFRAADAAGLKVPGKIWEKLVEAALRYQERPVEVPVDLDEATKEVRMMAGFGYEVGHAATASMTTAGLTVLGIATEQPGRVGRRTEDEIEQARALAMAWLEHHYSVEGNPGGPGGWHFYYLYGLERVCAFAGLDELAGHDWYAEGATQLIKEQREDGGWRNDGRAKWVPAPMPIANTCFGLLFLRKATLTGLGERRQHFHAVETSDSEVWVRVDARDTWTAWLSGFAPDTLARFEPERTPAGDERPGLHVEAVEWLLDGEVLERVAGDPAAPWNGERFAIRHTPQRAGRFELVCRVTGRDPSGGAVSLASKPIAITHELLLEPWMMEYARDAARNLLAREDVELSASSQESEFHTVGDVLDGMQGSAWWAAEDDAEPWVRLEFERGVRVREIWLSPAGASAVAREQCLAPVRAVLVLNDSKATVDVEFESDPRLKTKVELPRATLLKSLEVRLVGHGKEPGKCVGLAEIEGR